MTSYFDHFILISIYSFISDSLLMIISIISLFIIFGVKSKVIPSKSYTTTSIVFHKIFTHWSGLLKESGITKSNYYAHWLLTLFILILSLNLTGFMLFTFPVTTHLGITFGVAISVWIAINVMGFWKFGVKYLSMFMPNNSPLLLAPVLIIIELVSHMSKPIALGMRLAANLTAGHILLSILADFTSQLIIGEYILASLFPTFIIIFMVGLELGVVFIQAYVFCLLISIYLKDSVILH